MPKTDGISLSSTAEKINVVTGLYELSGPNIDRSTVFNDFTRYVFPKISNTPSNTMYSQNSSGRSKGWVMTKTGKNKSRTARILGIDRVSLYRKLKKYQIVEE